jgi:hypothetical protein
MNLHRTTLTCLKVMLAGAIAAILPLTPSSAQTNHSASFDPLEAYVGIWIATNPNETNPFLVLKLKESNGKLSATMSHFKIGGLRNGGIIWSPLPNPETPVSDLKVGDSGLWFEWSGDPPFHGGQVKFVAEGTSVAYINIPISEEETKKIYADHQGLAGLSPTIRMHRETEPANENEQVRPNHDWEEVFTARLINEAEFQYRFDHGVYADYPTLLRSGQLTKTRGLNFTKVPINLQSATDPLPGSSVRLLVSNNCSSYLLSLHEKTSVHCGSGFFTDETGVIFTGRTADCSAK